jgi:hypothetical protein
VRAVRTLTLALAVLAALLWTGAASATIIPQRSIADIALKMTGDQVKAVAGEPDRIHHGMNDFGNFTVYKYRRLKVTFLGSPGSQQVTAVSTTRRRQETPLGIHVGSTETALHTAYPGAHCRPFSGGAPRDRLPDRDRLRAREADHRRLRDRLSVSPARASGAEAEARTRAR